MATRTAAQPKRRRRTREQARDEIISAARSLLDEVPVHDATVVAIMARTTLSRKSFYVYFRDRAELLTALVAPLRADANETLQSWRDADDKVTAGGRALLSAAQVYHAHGTLLRALADAATRDQEAAAVWRSLIDPVVAVARHTIAEASAAGTSSGLDAQATARALVAMNVAFFFDELAGHPEADVEAVTETLATIWERTIYDRP